MKILAIRGKNLASLEGEFEVDFMVDPLLSAGIFAITGSTGSGKSTILDAICLALFDHTPRLSYAEGARESAVPDVKDTTLGQRDSRTLLRRGASEGYAEVDFLSSGGEKFRSTWSVRRAGNKTDGLLRPCSMRLLNLSTREEVQGQKKELLAKITELIGLTFDQFTRSVLLAQGDFASFLKADKQEKAALLEKLTGVEIYSRISISIYEKSKQADYDYLLLQQKIQGIEVLTEEQIAALTAERSRLVDEAEALKGAMSKADAKLKWIEKEAELQKSVREAEATATGIQHAIAAAAARYAGMEQFDRAQEIRSVFDALQSAHRQLEENERLLAEKTTERETLLLRLAQASEEVARWEAKQAALAGEWEKTKPEIIRARNMEVQMAGMKLNLDEAAKEWNAAQTAVAKVESTLRDLTREIDAATAAVRKHELWFEKGSHHQAMIPKIDWMIDLLDEAQETQRQTTELDEKSQACRRLLETEKAGREKLEAELTQLRAALPAEVAALRAKLVQGEPCPVCGSTHHPLHGVTGGQSAKEEELNRKKQHVSARIEKASAVIEVQKTLLTHLTALTENAQNRLAGTFAKLENHLSTLPDWQALFHQGVLQSKLRTFAGQWEQNTRQLSAAQQTVAGKTSLRASEQSNLEEANRHLAEKKKKHDTLSAAMDELQRERATLLGGKSADDTDRFYAGQQKTLSDALQKALNSQNTCNARHEAINGAMAQIHAAMTRLTSERTRQQNSLDAWQTVSGHETFSTARLTELFAKSAAWIAAEKQALNRLNEQDTISRATLEERTKNLDRHHSAEVKIVPRPEETAPWLAEKLSAMTAQSEQAGKRMTEIDLLLKQDETSRKRILAYGNALDEKRQLAENWKKLNLLFGSADGLKLKAIAQGYTLDALLTYANRHLQDLSARYKLQRIPETLALQVIDLDMLGEIRTVHSLSGGESFLVSLALALGLSSLSSSRMKVESLFIDEGFGSLDMDALRVAMDVLERLQTQGRKIGVISHIAEMTERIVTQIRIHKTVNGKSKVEIN
jgi:exonuclease SbcC